MIIFKGKRRFELTVDECYDEWVAILREYAPGRLYPTQHLLRTFATHEAAIEALKRKWQVLFPDEDGLKWRDPPAISTYRGGYRQRDSN